MQKNKFRKNLRAAREQMGLSQSDCAQKLNINITTYRNYENTDREPSYDTLIDIANLLKISIDDLLIQTNIIIKQTEKKDLLSDEKELLQLYSSVSPLNKGRALERLRILAETEMRQKIKENKISG